MCIVINLKANLGKEKIRNENSKFGEFGGFW